MYYCGVGEGRTPEEAANRARKNLAHDIYTFIKSETEKRVAKNKEKFEAQFSQEDFSFTALDFGNVQKRECRTDDGYKVIIYLSKEDYKDFIKKRFSSIWAELEKADLPLEELEKKKKDLQILKTVADVTGVDIEQSYKSILDKCTERVKEKFRQKYQTLVNQALSEVDKIVADKQKSYQEKKDFINKKIKDLENLREKFAKYGLEYIVDRGIEKLRGYLKKLEERTRGEIVVVIKRGRGVIYIDGQQIDLLSDTEEKVHTIMIKGLDGYETRSFKVRLKKGKTITKEVVLWSLDEAISSYSVGFGISTGYWTEHLIMAHYIDFKRSIFKPFYGLAIGYSLDRYGYITSLLFGAKFFKRNPDELLMMIGNDLISFSIGAFLGYYGFDDIDDKHFCYFKPFASLEWHLNPLISLENVFYYQKAAWKSEDIEPSSVGVVWLLNFYF